MLALILAGGGGTRLGLGEKPLVTIRGKPMIEYVIDAFMESGHDVVVVLSKKTPFTQNWCMAREIPCIIASGAGYVEDITEAVNVLGITGPFFTCVADLPCLSPNTIREIEERYMESGCEACSVWIPLDFSETLACRSSYTAIINGISACPAGINILRGDLIFRPQEELALLIQDRRLSFNINTREELALIRSLVRVPGKQRSGL